ncbi:unnamed protein product [Lactuca virosa]|uniref:Reverse transcriptase zinc-binding domain-containing protein n=1 Tax=Lactuca virosa TaxID=75947 RepID=A0AAU9MGE0_9ASTR|nr:unnamed protein product [Lactuca virosa]
MAPLPVEPKLVLSLLLPTQRKLNASIVMIRGTGNETDPSTCKMLRMGRSNLPMQGLRRSEDVEHGKINLIMGNKKASPVTKIGVYSLLLSSGVVGDGAQTRFWKDVWCSNIPLREQFGRLFALAVNQDARVSDYWSSGGWNFHWRRGIRGGVELTQFDDLVEILNLIRIGRFRISGLGSLIRQRVLLDRIPVRAKLVERGVVIDSLLCPMCHNSHESVNHLLLQCSVADQVWNRVEHWLHLDLPDFSSIRDMVDWVDSRLTVHMERSIVESVFMVVI